jgi:prepilin peptidase CpaA
MSAVVIWGLAVAVTAMAAFTDARTGRIPNGLNAVGLLSAFAVHAFQGIAGLKLAALGLVVSVLVPGLLHLVSRGQALGGGDVKLFAVLGAALGPFSGLEVQLLSYSLLLCFALCQLTYQGRLLQMLRNAAALLLRHASKQLPLAKPPALAPNQAEGLTTMRLGPAIFLAALLLAVHANFSWRAL